MSIARPPHYGRYTKSIEVATATQFEATGSLTGILAVVSPGNDYELELPAGGTITGSYLDAGIIHEIGVKKVTAKTSPVVVLYKVV